MGKALKSVAGSPLFLVAGIGVFAYGAVSFVKLAVLPHFQRG